jgi:type IV pilus assembly protein PilE
MKAKIYKLRGFTIIELLVVVLIVGILAAVAIPSYRNYVLRSNRIEGQTALNFVAQAQEKYYSTYNKYTNVMAGSPTTGLQIPATSCNGGSTAANCRYQISITTTAGGANFTAKATPINTQSTDVCGTLSLDGLGEKLPARSDTAANANGNCW